MRRETRRPVSRPGRLELDNGQTLLCRIADVSSGGALLLVDNAEWLPKRFTLVDIFDDKKRTVILVWNAPGKAGVKFEGSSGPVPPKPSGFGKRRA